MELLFAPRSSEITTPKTEGKAGKNATYVSKRKERSLSLNTSKI